MVWYNLYDSQLAFKVLFVYSIIQVVHAKLKKVVITDYVIGSCKMIQEQAAAAVVIALIAEKKQVKKKRKKGKACVNLGLKEEKT